MSISSSPDRHTFQLNSYIDRKTESGEIESPDCQEYIEFFKTWKERAMERESNPEWQQNNLEWDLRTTDWILKKARSSDVYAQNLYAALCNNEFVKLEVMNILKDERWRCSWRHAGGIIADMRQEGDYMDWYCSGIGGVVGESENIAGYVRESDVTDEIREDLHRLGWSVVMDAND